VYKVLSCREVPGLENHGIASSLQLRANPFGPILVWVGVADEEIFFNCLSPFFSERLIYRRIVFFVIWYLSKNSIALSIKYLNCKSQKGTVIIYRVAFHDVGTRADARNGLERNGLVNRAPIDECRVGGQAGW
jgi:hypothetical protein